jgi:GTP-binding protein HflX
MMNSLEKTVDRAILVGVGTRYGHAGDPLLPDPLEELRLLADTAGAEVAGTIVQARPTIDPATYIGKGKIRELKTAIEENGANLVIFDHDLAPAQGRNLEEELQVRVIDRSGLILDIFAIRAKTREAKTQVELAQLKYLLPRLTRRWTHLSRQAGGSILLRGPGETQLEIDRRRVRERIAHLSEVLKTIEKQRDVSRKSRSASFKIALAGYTNVGKSTLLNALSGADIPVENKLFKTLDSTTRAVHFPCSPEILVSDTVGFIRDLPHHLVASFQSTLAEVRDADALLHVIDITSPEWEAQEKTVLHVLHEIGVSGVTIVPVFNKIDRLGNPAVIQAALSRYPGSVAISAATGEGMDALRARLTELALSGRRTFIMSFDGQDDLLREIYRHATILQTDDDDGRIRLTFTISTAAAKRLNLPE